MQVTIPSYFVFPSAAMYTDCLALVSEIDDMMSSSHMKYYEGITCVCTRIIIPFPAVMNAPAQNMNSSVTHSTHAWSLLLLAHTVGYTGSIHVMVRIIQYP